MKFYPFSLVTAVLLLANCGGSDDQTNSTVEHNADTTAALHEEPHLQMSPYTYGIDISKYQGDEVNFLDFNQDSLSFVICKATEGTTVVDPDFKTNWQTITEKGYIGGAYHFYRSDDDPTTQANFFLANFPDPGDRHLPMVIDVEGGGINSSSTPEQVTADVLTFLKVLEEARGKAPIIYTNHSTGSKYLTSADFSKYPLWIADYSGDDEPNIPTIWEEVGWHIWQKTDNYQIDGKGNDFDVYNGSRAHLEAFLEKQ